LGYGIFNKQSKCHVSRFGKMSGCITTVAAGRHSEVVGGAVEKKKEN
jgi:hypothetical protein